MTDKLAITATGLGKAYSRDGGAFGAFRRAMTGRPDDRGFWALRDIGFSVAAGEAVGIVGENGSGKSTLLQLICGTLQPTSGAISVSGRIAAMLELGAGFDPDFTGRENVFLAASVYGLTDSEIRDRLPAIEAFAEIGPYIDRPVSEYSSGMYARLAFAVCAHVDADILVVDEILGVGDAAFRQKCGRFMQAFRQRGTLVFVSHDAGAVQGSCDRAIWLDHGRMVADGPVDEVLDLYMGAGTPLSDGVSDTARSPLHLWPPFEDARLGERNVITVAPFDPLCASHGFGGARIADCFLSTGNGERSTSLRGGQVVTLHICARVSADLASPIFGYIFRDAIGQNLFGDNTYLAYRRHPPSAVVGDLLEARLEFRMPYLPQGTYTVAPSIISGTQNDHVPVNWLEDALVLTVSGDAVRHGAVGVPMRSLRTSYRPAERVDAAAALRPPREQADALES